MSFLVTNRPIPKGCIDCWFKYDCTESVLLWHVPIAPARSPDCPLVPVPPHGRLIDADALKDVQQADAEFFKGSSDYGEKCRYDEAINAVANIVNAPTVIEAEEGKRCMKR